MPVYRYEGSKPCRYGTRLVRPGEEVTVSARPGKRWTPVPEVVPAPPAPEPEPETKAEPSTGTKQTSKSSRKETD